MTRTAPQPTYTLAQPPAQRPFSQPTDQPITMRLANGTTARRMLDERQLAAVKGWLTGIGER